MELVHVVRHKVLVEGKSVRSVAKETGLHRKTIRRYVRGAEPRKRQPVPRARPVHDAVESRIAKLVEQSPAWTTAKQKLTAQRVHDMLVEGEDGGEKCAVSYTVVKEIYRELLRRRAEVFIPLAYRPGDLAEVDFFEVYIDINGKRTKAFMFVMRLMFSGRDFCHLYPRQDATCFLDGHARAFAHFGCVPERILYDNLKAAVLKILVGSERQLALRFMAMSTHYVFEACFARPYTGHDKGGVEARGKGIRWQHLVPIPTGASLLDVSAKLLARIEKHVDADKYAEEARAMKPLPAMAYRAVKTAEGVAISPRALVKVDGAVYSVPCTYARLVATVHAGAFEIDLVCPGGERVLHARQPANGRGIRYMHYLRELRRKPQAVRQVAHLLVEELGAPYIALWIELVEQFGEKEGARRLAKVIGEIEDYGVDVVAARLADAKQRGSMLAERPAPKVAPGSVAVPEALARHSVERPDIEAYDELIDPGARPNAPGTQEPVDVADRVWGDADGDGLEAQRGAAGVLQ